MSDTLETKYYRTPEGTRYRVRIIADPDATSPRDADNATIMHTFDRDYISPDGEANRYRTYLRIDQPLVPREYIHDMDVCPVDARRAAKWAALHPEILAIRFLDRSVRDGGLHQVPWKAWADGYIAITRQSWEMCMGDSPLEGGPWKLDEYGNPDPDSTRRTPSVDEVIAQDLDAYNRWASGEYVGVVVEERIRYVRGDEFGPWDGHASEPPEELFLWQEIESCWGYDDQQYALKEALSWLPENVEEETD